MPFTDSIVAFINDSLKGGSLNGKRFEPGKYDGLATTLARKKPQGPIEFLPAVMDKGGNYSFVEPNDKYPISLYHKVVSNTYSYDKVKSFGDEYQMKCIADMYMVVFFDTRKTGLLPELMETKVMFGVPQKLSQALQTQLKFRSCLITPYASNMDKISVFKQEYPGTEYFLKPVHQLFLIRYRIESTFDKNCIDVSLCGD